MIRLAVPEDLRQGPQPFLFAEWFCGSRVRRWMEYERRNEYVTRLARPGPGRRILDIGCNWGYACMCAARAGAEAWGVDIDQSSIEFGLRLASANGLKIRLSYANARSLPFEDETFDAATAIETIEHVPRPDRTQFLREMARVLKPGGLAVLSTPNPAGTAEAAKRLFGRSTRMRRRFYGSYHNDERKRVLPSGDVMVDLLLEPGELTGHLKETELELTALRRIVFVNKFLPERLLAPAKVAEWILERLPIVRRFGSTTVYVLKKGRAAMRPH